MKSDVQLNLELRNVQRALIDICAAEILHVTYRFSFWKRTAGLPENAILTAVYLTLTMSNMSEFIICLMHRSQMILLSKKLPARKPSVRRNMLPRTFCPFFISR